MPTVDQIWDGSAGTTFYGRLVLLESLLDVLSFLPIPGSHKALTVKLFYPSPHFRFCEILSREAWTNPFQRD